jgi:flagellar hook-length control protein FliK
MMSASPTLISPEPKLVDRAAEPRSLDRARTTGEPSFRELLQAAEDRRKTTETPREPAQTDRAADEQSVERESSDTGVDDRPTDETGDRTSEPAPSPDARSDETADAEASRDDAQPSTEGQNVPVDAADTAQHQPVEAQALPSERQSAGEVGARPANSSVDSSGKSTSGPVVHQTVRTVAEARVSQEAIESTAKKEAATSTAEAGRREPPTRSANQPVGDAQRAVATPPQGRPAEAPASTSPGDRATGSTGTSATAERAVDTLRQQAQADSGQQQSSQDAGSERRRPTMPNVQSSASATPAAGRAIEVDDAVRLENLARSSGGETNVRIQPLTTGTGAAQASMKVDAVEQLVSSNATTSSSDEQTLTSRIVRGLSTMVHQRGGTMSMRLSPPELGALRVQMSIVQGNVTAQFTATTPQARALLEQNMGVLRTALEQHGLTVDRLAVHLSPSESNNAARQDMSGQQQQGQTAHQHNAGGGESRGRFDGERGGSFDHRDGPREFQLDLESFAASFADEAETASTGADES